MEQHLMCTHCGRTIETDWWDLCSACSKKYFRDGRTFRREAQERLGRIVSCPPPEPELLENPAYMAWLRRVYAPLQRAEES